jgi:putative tricarboxylic transport membrane protein
MNPRVPRDVVAGLLCLALSLWLFALTYGLPRSALVPIGPDFYPRIVLGLTAVLSVAVTAQGVLAARRAPAGGGAPRRNHRLVVLTFLIFGLYVAALPYLGYRIATALFVAAVQLALEPPSSAARWGVLAAIALLTAWVTYVVFERYLLVLPPRGAWTGF